MPKTTPVTTEMVKAIAGAQGELKSLSVDPSLLSGEEEKEVLEDLIVAAVNDAIASHLARVG